jgi:hypothetical protein
MHDWRPGATVLSANLAVCKGCGSLRVLERGVYKYIRRVASIRDERVFDEEPPCVPVVRSNASTRAW